MLNPDQAAEQLGISVRRVRGLIRAGLIVAYNVSPGRYPRYLLRSDALEDFLRRRQVVAPVRAPRVRSLARADQRGRELMKKII